MCTDYEILSKALADRMKVIMFEPPRTISNLELGRKQWSYKNIFVRRRCNIKSQILVNNMSIIPQINRKYLSANRSGSD